MSKIMNRLRQIAVRFGYRDWKPVEYKYLAYGTVITYECSITKERKGVYEDILGSRYDE